MPRNATCFEVERDDADNNIGMAGAFYFLRNEAGQNIGVLHGCPCGCGGRSALFFRGLGSGQQEWDVQGEWPKVTLTPSIGIKYDANGNKPANGSYHWHGYLENGVFVER